jgi:hypothetical protein
MLDKFELSSILALVTLTFTSFTTAQTVKLLGNIDCLRSSQNVSSANAKPRLRGKR